VRALALQHLRLRAPPSVAARVGGSGPAAVAQCWFARGMSAPADGGGDGGSGSDSAVRARVVELVRKFDKIDADKVGSCLCSASIFILFSVSVSVFMSIFAPTSCGPICAMCEWDADMMDVSAYFNSPI
jgi:hypothetical protein